MEKHRLFTTSFSSVYPLYITKAERKNRTKEEVENPIMREIRYLDNLIDELAKGKKSPHNTFKIISPFCFFACN